MALAFLNLFKGHMSGICSVVDETRPTTDCMFTGNYANEMDTGEDEFFAMPHMRDRAESRVAVSLMQVVFGGV